jgi:hypothetical protein
LAVLAFQLASARAADVTAFVETIGNAFTNRYPSVAQNAAKPVTRMRLFNNRIYLGHGSTTTILKTAPIDCWSIDLAQDAFVKDGAVFEEQIDQLRVFGNRLYMNGADSMGQGAFYRRDLAKGWQMFNVGPDAHYQDIYDFNGYIYTAYSNGSQPFVYYSTDDGASFQLSAPFGTSGGGSEFFEFKGKLYLSVNKVSGAATVPYILQVDGPNLIPKHADYANFFADNTTVALVRDFTTLNGTTGVFIGTGSQGGNNSFFTTTDVEAPNNAQIVAPPAGLPPGSSSAGYGAFALRNYDNVLYAAYNFRVTNNVNVVSIWVALIESTDGVNWTEKFRFTTGARARGMERAPNGDFYFGAIGTLTAEAKIPGNIWRVRHEVINAPALPVVGLSADKLSVFEGSGANLALRIRRAGPTNSPLNVNYSVAGSAVAGTDYAALSGTATIPAGEQSTLVPISILVNPAVTGARTLTVTLDANAAYTVAAPSAQTFTISDQTAGSTPIPLDGLALWLKADQGVTADGGGKVSAWADQSGRGFTALQGTLAKQPVVVTGSNGRPALQFDGNDWLNVGAINTEAYYTAIYFTPDAPITTASQQPLLNYMSYAEGGGSALYLGDGQNNTFSGPETVSIYDQAWVNGSLSAAGHVLTLSQPAPAASFQLRIDAPAVVQTLVPASNGELRIITPNCDAVRVGTVDGTSGFQGKISEIILYNRPLTAAENLIVEAYLNQRYATPNLPPNAGDDAVTRNPGSPIAIPVAALLANDTDPTGDPLTILSVGSALPAGAQLSYVGNTITYTPPLFNNADGSFTYQLSDGAGGLATGTVTITVNNNPPVAVNDTVPRLPSQSLLIPAATLLGNDSDPDADTLSISSFDAVTSSGATVVAEGAGLRYTAPNGFNSTDSFSYTISDGRGLTATAQVTVTVPNTPPFANTDNFSTTVGKSFTANLSELLANDFDLDQETFEFTKADTRTLHGGTVRISIPTGKFIYVPPTGYSGEDTFGYWITDARGALSVGVVSFNVTVDNNPPTPGADMFTREPNKPISVLFTQLLANDSDPDNDALTVVAVMGRSPAGAKILMTATGLTYTAPVGYNGIDTFSYTVRDARGAMATATVTIKVQVASAKATSIKASAPTDSKFAATLADHGKIALQAASAPGSILVIESSSDFLSWKSLGLIRAGQDGVAYFEQPAGGEGLFFKVTPVKP